MSDNKKRKLTWIQELAIVTLFVVIVGFIWILSYTPPEEEQFSIDFPNISYIGSKLVVSETSYGDNMQDSFEKFNARFIKLGKGAFEFTNAESISLTWTMNFIDGFGNSQIAPAFQIEYSKANFIMFNWDSLNGTRMSYKTIFDRADVMIVSEVAKRDINLERVNIYF